jgi:hypothetical protein
MTQAPVKPTVQKKASMQACCGYSVRIFWFQKGFHVKSSAPVKPTVIGAIPSAEDYSWSLTASGQAVCDRLNRRWRAV